MRLHALDGDKEIIVVDGGSQDATVAIAREHARVIVSGRGRGRQMNAGAQVARGCYLVFVHADCVLARDALAEVKRTLAQGGVVAGCFRQRIAGTHSLYRLIERCADWRAARWQICYGDSGLFLERLQFERVGGFPDVALFEDLGIARRLRRAGRIALAAAVIEVSPRRWEAHGVVRTTVFNWLLTLAFLSGVPEETLSRLYYHAPHWPRSGQGLEPS
ncbi:MAG: TIGR04283 family arsenosugar biosynthesis glycosyltransferase [Planctomycetota bacterium]